MARRTTQFPMVAVTAEWCRPRGGDDQADGAVPGRSGDGCGGGGGRGGGGLVQGATLKAEAEREHGSQAQR
jgi:hypothetical protein